MATMTRATPAIAGIALVVVLLIFFVFRDDDGETAASPTASASASAAASASVAASASPSATEGTATGCAPEELATKTPGTFTVGTDNPAFPPYFSEPGEGETATEPWEFGDPTNGRGFESAIAY